MKTKAILLALGLIACTACEFGVEYDERSGASVTGGIESVPNGVDGTPQSGSEWEQPAGEPGIDEEPRTRTGPPEVAHPGNCLDLSSGSPVLVPCMPGGPNTGDTSHGDPQPWIPGAPTPIPQPY